MIRYTFDQIAYDPQTLEWVGPAHIDEDHPRTATWSVDGYRDDEDGDLIENHQERKMTQLRFEFTSTMPFAVDGIPAIGQLNTIGRKFYRLVVFANQLPIGNFPFDTKCWVSDGIDGHGKYVPV